MVISQATAQRRARVAALSRDREPDEPTLLEAKRDLTAEKLADYVTRTIAAAPPLTEAQRERIFSLLRAGGAA